MTPGSTIAHYKIAGKLGEGGMGAVYRATDTRLNRDVAIKVLPPAFAEDTARMQRFEREAQVLASLNHPNIAAIYGIEAGAIVMELVEGGEIAGPVPIDTAIAYSRQIAAALEAAHEKGIVHRDLKPANIKVTPDGVVKVLDFGLAKASEDSSAKAGTGSPTISPTLSLSMTQAGMILGTAAYMSPEQARGKTVDKRADIWAFGVVLFELLTGRPLFGGGETASDAMAAVIIKEPDWNALPAATPLSVRRLMEHCLRKDPKLRLRDIGDARILLEERGESAAVAAVAASPVRRWLWMAAGVIGILVGGAAVAGWYATRPTPMRPLMRLSAEFGSGTELAPGAGSRFAVSPDGTRLAAVVKTASGQQLAVRLLQQEGVTLLQGTEGATSPFFSPDGEWIAFGVDRTLKKVSFTGGAPLTLGEVGLLRGASWPQEDTIVIGVNSGPLLRIPAVGGAPAQLTKLAPDERTHRGPHWVPELELLLFTCADSTNYDAASICAQSLKTGTRATLWRGGHSPRYLKGGYLVYQNQSTLFAARLDARRLALAGSPVPVMENVGITSSGLALFAFTASGNLVFSGGQGRRSERSLVWLDEAGKEQELHAKPGQYFRPRLSPDNRKLAFEESGAVGAPTGEIWMKDLDRGTTSRLTFTAGANGFPVWTPDGKSIVYRNAGPSLGIYLIPADGSSPAQRLSERDAHPWSFSPAKRLIMHVTTQNQQIDLVTAAFEGDAAHPRLGPPELFLGTAHAEVDGQFSPDGRWIAYGSNESPPFQVYVRPFPGPGGRWQISTGGGMYPRWSPKGNELFYESNEGIMAVAYTVSGNTFTPGKTRRWTSAHPSRPNGFYAWDVAADGKRLVISKDLGGEVSAKPEAQLTYVQNFLDEVKRKVK